MGEEWGGEGEGEEPEAEQRMSWTKKVLFGGHGRRPYADEKG